MSDKKKYEIEGTISKINDTKEFASGFKKREFVIKTTGEYPQEVALEFVKDHCAKLDSFRPGDGAKVYFDIRGNEYNGRHYVQLSAWKIEKADDHSVGARSSEYGGNESRSSHQNGAAPPARDNGGGSASDDFDSIPFAAMAMIPGF